MLTAASSQPTLVPGHHLNMQPLSSTENTYQPRSSLPPSTFKTEHHLGEQQHLPSPKEVDGGTRKVITSFLLRCDIPYPLVPFDSKFHESCCGEAILRGYPMEGLNSLRPFIYGGVAMATTAYAHLADKSTQVFISLYTASLIYLDDVFQHNVEAVRNFNERFVQRKPQEDAVLDAFANLVSEMPRYFGRVASNVMTTSTLNLVTALSLEYETQDMLLSTEAQSYPTFSRVMSGASEAYALFAFTPDLPLQSYIQALPELMVFINNGNDILSFYKEELAGETVNRVSFLAACHNIPKTEALRRLADDAVEAHARILEILSPHKRAYDMYTKFSRGYIGFHAALSRYKLHELDL